jgi:hypothetical protein
MWTTCGSRPTLRAVAPSQALLISKYTSRKYLNVIRALLENVAADGEAF